MTDNNHAVSQALLQAVAGQYHDVPDTLLTTEVDASVLPGIIQEISNDRDEALTDLKQTSRSVAPDVDGWIQQANKLQADIQRSKTTAREIVQQAERAVELRRKHEDVSRKADLLRKEVAFNQRLETVLASIQGIFNKIVHAQSALKEGQLKTSLEQVKDIEISLAELRKIENTSVVDVLSRRASSLRDGLVAEVKTQWSSSLKADRKSATFEVCPSQSDLQLGDVQEISSELHILPTNIQQTWRDLVDVILRPRLEPARDGHVTLFAVEDRVMRASGRTSETDTIRAINDLLAVVHFLNSNIPQSINVELSEILMPGVISQLGDHWLMPSVPTSLDGLTAFEAILDRVKDMADELSKIGWTGSADLQEWVEQAPRIWLAKKKEQALNEVRHALATQLTQTKTVERVETQVVAKDDVIHGPNGAGDEWDAWGEEEEEEEKPALPDRPDQQKPRLPDRPTGAASAHGEEDDFSAWGAEDDADEATKITTTTNGNADDDEGDAWGAWEDAAPTSAPASPVKSHREPAIHQPNNTSRTLTLKETYIVTTIPTFLHDLISDLLSDASTLLNPTSTYHTSPIAPAATGIYTLPTLILACFRALAPTYYAPLSSGLMTLYNDTQHLITLLQHLQSTIPDTTTTRRIRLDTDIATLTSFGARSYTYELNSQRTILRDLLDGAQGFTNSSEPPFKQACEDAVRDAVDRVRDVARSWTPVLSRSVCLQALGSLVGAVTGKLVVEITELADISDDESKVLRGLCDQITTLSELFAPEGSVGSGSAGNNLGEATSASLIHIYVPSWFRFQYLSEILVSTLVDIRYLWNEGELKMEFEADEVVMLVEALFAESELRRRCVNEIRRG